MNLKSSFKFILYLTVKLVLLINNTLCSDITNNVFGPLTDGLPAAFGDFNSDELTDIFVLRDESRTLEIFLAAEEEPLLRTSRSNPLKCSFEDKIITSVVPGDFDGDALMDVLVTTVPKNQRRQKIMEVYIMWGGTNHLNCTNSEKPLLSTLGQPLAIDYDGNMIIDLFGLNEKGQRMFWVFLQNERKFKPIAMNDDNGNAALKHPHAHAFLDLNEDFMADLFLTAEDQFEVWLGQDKSYVFNHTISHPSNAKKIGQSLFIDLELRGRMDLITPVCFDNECKNSSLMVYCDNKWHNLQVNFKDANNKLWRFQSKSDDNLMYRDTITLHSGDYNMDGYPDILVTMISDDKSPQQSFLLENVPCDSNCGAFTRTFIVKWNILKPFTNGTVMAAFFDFYQDGVLDVILVQINGSGFKSAAYKNSLDYDANFIKVMVITGLKNSNNAMIDGRVGKKRRTYGTNLPGPRISYKTTTQEGDIRHAASAQLPQSAHFSLNLPYNIFGLGRTPNFVDTLTVGLSTYSRTWTQIIPNSQMVVIPWPVEKPSQWKAQLFVTPSKLILMSVAGLTTACCLITIIIGVLHWKERQEDKKERLSETHRFHFDAM
nr:T-cell immunomodulatory protein [Onthophagus taurus]